MLKSAKEHFYMSDDMREFLYVMRVFKTPWIIPVILVALVVYFFVATAFLFG